MRWSAFLVLFSSGLFLMSSIPSVGGEKGKKDSEKTQKKAESGSFLLVVPPAGGKEVKLADWRFVQGTKHFSVSGDDKVSPKTKGPTGPEYLEFRELKSTTYKNGIFTLIPLTGIKKITYDREKKLVNVVAIADGPEEVALTGSTGFTTSNRLAIEAEAQLEGLGAATVKFLGGTDKGMHSIAFPSARPIEKVKGTAATVIADDKEKSKHVAYDIQPLYLVDGAYRVLPVVHFKKTVKIELDKVASIRFVPSLDKKKISTDYEVTLKDGMKHTLSLLTTIELDKKKSMTFVGLIGRVPVGYKLFSVDAIYEFQAAVDEKK